MAPSSLAAATRGRLALALFVALGSAAAAPLNRPSPPTPPAPPMTHAALLGLAPPPPPPPPPPPTPDLSAPDATFPWSSCNASATALSYSMTFLGYGSDAAPGTAKLLFNLKAIKQPALEVVAVYFPLTLSAYKRVTAATVGGAPLGATWYEFYNSQRITLVLATGPSLGGQAAAATGVALSLEVSLGGATQLSIGFLAEAKFAVLSADGSLCPVGAIKVKVK